MAEPKAERPGFAAVYGIAESPEGMLGWDWAVERLSEARNYWLTTTRTDGRPHSRPVWGLWSEGALVFSTAPHSVKGMNLSHDPRVSVNLESGDEVVILEGEAELTDLDADLADAYERKYAYRPEPGERGEGWFRVPPTVVFAWTEKDMPRTATRFRF